MDLKRGPQELIERKLPHFKIRIWIGTKLEVDIIEIYWSPSFQFHQNSDVLDMVLQQNQYFSKKLINGI